MLHSSGPRSTCPDFIFRANLSWYILSLVQVTGYYLPGLPGQVAQVGLQLLERGNQVIARRRLHFKLSLGQGKDEPACINQPVNHRTWDSGEAERRKIALSQPAYLFR